MGRPRLIDKQWVSVMPPTEIDGKMVGIFMFTTACSDGTLWSRIVRTDGVQTEGWFQHPDIPDRE